jgi:hypothetical protein
MRAGEPRAGGDLDAVGFFALDALPELALPTDVLVIDSIRSSVTR